MLLTGHFLGTAMCSHLSENKYLLLVDYRNFCFVLPYHKFIITS
jgi:hypothetical protein